jgi:hypothetical protein
MPTDLDQIIDAALPSYAAEEPQPGLEHRILARALAEPHRRGVFVWTWRFALPALSCLLLSLTMRQHHVVSPATSPNMKAATQPPKADLATKTAPVHGSRNAPKNRFVQDPVPNADKPLPKEDTFPSPAPLTAEEQALLAYNSVQLRATAAQHGVDLKIPSLGIAELRIKPLDIPALDQPASNPAGVGQNDQQP